MKYHRYESGKSESFRDLDPLLDLEEKIANRYEVYPVDSRKAYEELTQDGTHVERVVHKVFAVKFKGKQTDKSQIREACNNIWDLVKMEFPAGNLVIWRRRPEVTEENILDETCPRCGSITKVEEPVTQVRIRIGCLIPTQD